MAEKLNLKKVSLSVGITFAILHILGVIGILAGLLTWWQSLHFISIPFTVQAFSIGTLIIGIIKAFVCGAVVGLIFAVVYNNVAKK